LLTEAGANRDPLPLWDKVDTKKSA
jgi:hypothetical protein